MSEVDNKHYRWFIEYKRWMSERYDGLLKQCKQESEALYLRHKQAYEKFLEDAFNFK